MKKVIFIILVTLLPLIARGYTIIDGINYDLTLTGAEVCSISGGYSGNIVIPESVTTSYTNSSGQIIETTYYVNSIGNDAFTDCTELTSVSMPDAVTYIGSYAFYGCSSLKTVNIPSNLTYIGSCAFCGCHNLRLNSLTIPSGVTSIGYRAFWNCNGLTSVTIPSSVKSIGSQAFEYCYYLTSVTFNGVGSLNGSDIFEGCSRLTSITMKGVKSIGQYSFSGTPLIDIHISNLAEWCGISFHEKWIDYNGSDGGFYLYLNDKKVTHLNIPKDDKTFNRLAFKSCRGLETITVEKGNTVFDSRQDCNAIIETGSNTLLKGCQSTFIPEGVSAIADYAFLNCDGLISITIPESMTSIGDYAFYKCKLRNLLVRSATPPTTTTDSFSNQTYQHTTLYVPTGSWDAYAYDDAWYKFNNIRETATAEEQLSPMLAYTLMETGTFTYSVYDPVNNCIGTINSVIAIDENNPNHCWQVIETEDSRYIYNVGAKKFLMALSNGSFALTNVPTPIEMENGSSGIILGAQKSRQWALVSNDRMSAEQAVIDGIRSLTPALSKSEEDLYDLSGRKMDRKPAKPGLYIQNGRKVLLK